MGETVEEEKARSAFWRKRSQSTGFGFKKSFILYIYIYIYIFFFFNIVLTWKIVGVSEILVLYNVGEQKLGPLQWA